jgi:hypothetical protein
MLIILIAPCSIDAAHIVQHVSGVQSAKSGGTFDSWLYSCYGDSTERFFSVNIVSKHWKQERICKCVRNILLIPRYLSHNIDRIYRNINSSTVSKQASKLTTDVCYYYVCTLLANFQVKQFIDTVQLLGDNTQSSQRLSDSHHRNFLCFK